MHEHHNFFVAIDGTEVALIPLSREADPDTTPCTYHNATNQTVYLWHWRGSGVSWEDPCLVKTLPVGKSIVIHFPETFIVRASYETNPLSPVIEESNVGDIPRHIVLADKCFVPSKPCVKESSLT
jgi:hypothetical protein